MVVGLAWALRAIQGAPTTPAAPAASFRKSRRRVLDGAGRAMPYPLVYGASSRGPRSDSWSRDRPARSGSCVHDPAPGTDTSSSFAGFVSATHEGYTVTCEHRDRA